MGAILRLNSTPAFHTAEQAMKTPALPVKRIGDFYSLEERGLLLLVRRSSELRYVLQALAHHNGGRLAVWPRQTGTKRKAAPAFLRALPR
jgi:hypothetical protein